MSIKQISVFLENKPVCLPQVSKLLGENGINIRALSIADTVDFGILRLIVNEPQKAHRCLQEEGMTVSVADVVAVEVEDRPGGLYQLLRILEKNGVGIEYLYAFVQKKKDKALVVLRTVQTKAAEEALAGAGIHLLEESEVYTL